MKCGLGNGIEVLAHASASLATGQAEVLLVVFVDDVVLYLAHGFQLDFHVLEFALQLTELALGDVLRGVLLVAVKPSVLA